MKHERLKFQMQNYYHQVGNLGVLCEERHINAHQPPTRVREKKAKSD